MDRIATRWTSIGDPKKFLKRYEQAMRNYLRAILKEPDAVDEVFQECMVRHLKRDFVRSQRDQGRFRYYLKRSIRNAAMTFLRNTRRQKLVAYDMNRVIAPPKDDLPEDLVWLADWRKTLLQRAWKGLADLERVAPESLCYTVLRLTADWPNEDSVRLAARAAKLSGRPVSAEAFRKQLSRARRRFAEQLVLEVGQTLERPTLESVEQELIDLNLIEYVRHILPGAQRSSGTFVPPRHA